MKPTITRIQAINLKTKTADASLAPLTAIIGPNGSGKSSIREGITLALIGYSPTLGKTKTGQLLHVGAKRLDIKATLSTDESINRRWEQGRSLKATADGPDFSESLHPAQLDFSVFANAKPTDRQRVLESLIVSTAPEDIATEARRMIADGGLDLKVDPSAAGWLATLENDAKETARFENQNRETASKTALTLSAAEEPPAVQPSEIEAAAARLETTTQDEADTRARLDALDDRLQRAPDRPEGEPVTAASIAAAHESAEEARETYEREKAAWDKFNLATERAAEIRRRIHPSLEPAEHPGVEFPSDIAGKLKLAEQHAADAVRANDRAVEAELAIEREKKALVEKWERLKASGCCPECGTAGGELTTALGELFQPQIDALDGRLVTAKATTTTAAAEVTKADEERARLSTLLRHAAEREAWELEQQAAAIVAEAARPTSDLADLATAASAAARHHRALQSNAGEWEAWNRADIPSPESIEAARKAWEGAKALKDAAKQSSDALAAAKAEHDRFLADRRRLTELETAVADAEKKVTAAKALAAWAKAKSLETTVEAMKPLLELCNAVCAGVLSGPVVIDGTDIGVQADGGVIALETLSGSEAVALGAALQIAIASRADVRIVLIDELNRFAGERHERFIDNLAAVLAAGHVDQVVVFDHGIGNGTASKIQAVGGTVVEMA
jgi:energy-coupling factor transporter ATP-binding protein EcfA2